MLHRHRPSDQIPVVAIAGAGFAGTMTAVHLLRNGSGPLEVVLIDRSGEFGRGVAYSSVDVDHLLNVPGELMSAFCEQPLHFSAWARRETGVSAPAEFMPRGLYGDYLSSVLAEAERQAESGRRLVRLGGEVVDVAGEARCLRLDLADGSRIECDRLVLATGPVSGALGLALPADPRIVPEPWATPGALRPGEDERTLIVGMGLTAVDVILSLTRESTRGEVVAISRSGAFPHRHLAGLRFPAPAPALPEETVGLAELEFALRTHIAEQEELGHDWRDSFDGLRAVTPMLWRRLSSDGRKRFLAERMREWERRRHRMAPAVAARLDSLGAGGRLSTRAARLIDVDNSGARLRARVEASADGTFETIECDRIVACAGAGMDIRHSGNPLLDSLLQSGTAVPDELRLGLRTSAAGALIDGVGGQARERIFGLGAIRRGELWETTAVGEIRVQARDLALEIWRTLATRSAAEPSAAVD